MKKTFKILGCATVLVFSLIIAFIIFGIFGFRFNPEMAARAHFAVEKEKVASSLIDFMIGPHRIYIFETDSTYLTVLARRSVLLWRSNDSVWIKKFNDKIVTIGIYSLNEDHIEDRFTLLAFINNDSNITYIEAGPPSERLRLNTPEGEITLFLWNKSIPWNDWNAIAYTVDHEALYELRYEVNNGILHSDGLRWHRIENMG